MLAVANAQLSCNCQHKHERNPSICNLQLATWYLQLQLPVRLGYQILRYTFRVCAPPTLPSILWLSQLGIEFLIFPEFRIPNQNSQGNQSF